MHTRIKYNFEGPIGISRQTYGTTSGENVRIVVDKENFTFEIVNPDGKALVQGGGVTNYGVLLRKAKKALVSLGYDFAVEDRDRNYGIVSKQTENT